MVCLQIKHRNMGLMKRPSQRMNPLSHVLKMPSVRGEAYGQGILP